MLKSNSIPQNDPVASVQQSYDYLNKADYVK